MFPGINLKVIIHVILSKAMVGICSYIWYLDQWKQFLQGHPLDFIIKLPKHNTYMGIHRSLIGDILMNCPLKDGISSPPLKNSKFSPSPLIPLGTTLSVSIPSFCFNHLLLFPSLPISWTISLGKLSSHVNNSC